MESSMSIDVIRARLRIDVEECVQLPGLILIFVFSTGLLDGFGKVMIIRDRVAFLVRSKNRRHSSFELVGIPFHGWVDDLPQEPFARVFICGMQ